MKVLLVEPPFYLFQNLKSSASLGLAMLAAMARKKEHEVKIFSPDLIMGEGAGEEGVITNKEEDGALINKVNAYLHELILDFNPRIVGLSLWTARFDPGIKIANMIKKYHPESVILAGGIHCNIMPEQVLRTGYIDYLIRGEGEHSFIDFINAIEEEKAPENASVGGLSWINKAGEYCENPVSYCTDLDELPFPAYESYIDYEKVDKNAFGSIMFSRGCPFNCSFCASWKIWTRKVRSHSPEYIVNAVEELKRKYGTDWIRFDDDTFTLRKQPVLDICRLLKENNINIKWHCDTRVELVSPELLSIMKDAGLQTIAMGIESGDVDMRKKIRKVSQLETVRNAFRIAHDMNVKTVGYFMIGFPGETYEQANTTLNFVEEIKPDFPCISICIPYPGTDTFRAAMELGIVEDENNLNWSALYHHSDVNFSGNISEEEWQRLLKKSKKIHRKAKRREMYGNEYGYIVNNIIRLWKDPKMALNVIKNRIFG